MTTSKELLQDMVRQMDTLDHEQREFAIGKIGELSEAKAGEIYNTASFGAQEETDTFVAIFTATAGSASQPKPQQALRELVRTAALTERERGDCYRRLAKFTDREVRDMVLPRLAQSYEDAEHAARELRVVLLEIRRER